MTQPNPIVVVVVVQSICLIENLITSITTALIHTGGRQVAPKWFLSLAVNEVWILFLILENNEMRYNKTNGAAL